MACDLSTELSLEESVLRQDAREDSGAGLRGLDPQGPPTRTRQGASAQAVADHLRTTRKVTPMRNKTILIVLVGVFLTLNFLDFATTMYAVMHVRGEEANPIVNALGGPLDPLDHAINTDSRLA